MFCHVRDELLMAGQEHPIGPHCPYTWHRKQRLTKLNVGLLKN